MTDSPIALELNDVALSRGGRELAAGLSFALRSGQLALVTGPNGCGKTTLLRTIAGLLEPARGAISIGTGFTADRASEGPGQVAYHAHADGLKKDLTTTENLRFYSRLWNSPENLDEILSEVGLSGLEQRLVRHLSAGQKRRLNLAVLTMMSAPVWLLDEPLTNLDADGVVLVGRRLDRHLSAGGLALVATHQREGLERPGCLLVEL